MLLLRLLCRTQVRQPKFPVSSNEAPTKKTKQKEPLRRLQPSFKTVFFLKPFLVYIHVNMPPPPPPLHNLNHPSVSPDVQVVSQEISCLHACINLTWYFRLSYKQGFTVAATLVANKPWNCLNACLNLTWWLPALLCWWHEAGNDRSVRKNVNKTATHR